MYNFIVYVFCLVITENIRKKELHIHSLISIIFKDNIQILKNQWEMAFRILVTTATHNFSDILQVKCQLWVLTIM